MDFEIVSEITDIETIAVGNGVRDRARLRKQHGKGRWRKLKGVASVRLTVKFAVETARLSFNPAGYFPAHL